MNASDPLIPLRQLAVAAEVHAREKHRQILKEDDIRMVDRILQAEVAGLTPEQRESLVAIYGAWLGWHCVRRWNSRWVGLSESAPPRVLVQGLPFSPMDAIRLRLVDPGKLPLPHIVTQIDAWLREQAVSHSQAAAKNKAAWDALADDPRFAGGPLPPDRESARAALDEWLRDEPFEGRKLLCLGAGGGRQGPLHAMAGAEVTVVDVSERQLEHDRKAGLKTLCASMEKLDTLESASFDIVVQPVCSSYVPNLDPVHAEVARVLKPGGLYIVQHKQPIHLQVTTDGAYCIHIPYVEGVSALESKAFHREPGTLEFVHTLDTLLGGLCRAGFVIEAISEPPRGDFWGAQGSAGLRAFHLPPYLKIKARRV